MRLRLPPTATGFGVDTAAGIVHRRHPSHQTGALHRTTPTGARNIALVHRLVLCKECFPPPMKAPPARVDGDPDGS
jgi:hypothetical protein